MVNAMQVSLKQVRQVLGLGVQELADRVGLTSSPFNLETGKIRMSVTQYIAVCAVIDNYVEEKPELLPVLSTILSSHEEEDCRGIFEKIERGFLLKKWFTSFSDQSLGVTKRESPFVTEGEMRMLAGNCRIFPDRTILCEEGFPRALKVMNRLMQENKAWYVIPVRVVEEIQRQMLSARRLWLYAGKENTLYIARKGETVIPPHREDDMVLILFPLPFSQAAGIIFLHK